MYNRCVRCVSISNCVLNRAIVLNYAHIYLATIVLEIVPASQGLLKLENSLHTHIHAPCYTRGLVLRQLQCTYTPPLQSIKYVFPVFLRNVHHIPLMSLVALRQLLIFTIWLVCDTGEQSAKLMFQILSGVVCSSCELHPI